MKSQVPQRISWGLQHAVISLDEAATFFSLCAVLHHEQLHRIQCIITRGHKAALMLLSLLRGHLPPHRCYLAPAWAARKCCLSCLSLVQQIWCPEKMMSLPSPLQG